MSVIEMSHRSPEFEQINAAAEAGLRRHLGVPADYAVIFVQGGGSLQFSMVPMNLALPGKPVPRDIAGHSISTAMLAFSETWIRV